MKILRITAQGLPLFKKDLDICFYTQQRVCEEDKDSLYRLTDNYYLHSACAFIGINASGKTSVLKVISLALNIVKNEPINHVEAKSILGGAKNVTIRTYFYDKRSYVCCLERSRKQGNMCIRFCLKAFGKNRLQPLSRKSI